MKAEARTPERFKNRQAALKWLQSRGQISRSKFYDDCNAGLIAIQPDKTLSKFEVALYAEKLFTATRQTAGSGTIAAQREADEARKVKAEADLKELQADNARRENDRKWLYRDDAVADLAVIIASLQRAFEHRVRLAADAIIKLSNGDVSRTFDVAEGIQELVIDAGFNEVATAGTLRVRFKDEGDHDEQ